MSALPRPDDPELEILYECEMREKQYVVALEVVEKAPHLAARALAEVWFEREMLEALRGSIR